MSVLVLFTNLSATFLILRSNERDMNKNVHWSSCKVPVIPILMKPGFSRQMRNTEVSNFMKIRHWEPKGFMRVDWPAGRHSRHDEARSRFSQFCERA